MPFFFPSIADPEHAELLAWRRGVQLALEPGARKIFLESDFQGAVQAVMNKELDRPRYSPLVEEIKGLLTVVDEFRVCLG